MPDEIELIADASGPGPQEYKAAPFYVKQIEDRTVKQYFAVIGNIDDGGDRIHPGAFTKTLSERMNRIKVLWQHDTTAPPIGVPQRVVEVGRADLPAELLQRHPDAKGALYGEVKYLDTPRGNEVLVGIREGAITENSIGYDVVVGNEKRKAGEPRDLKELRLWDISPVNWGMNAATMNLKLSQVWGVADLERAVRAARAIAPRTLIGRKLLSPSDLDRWNRALDDLTDLLTAEPSPENDEQQTLTVKAAKELMARMAAVKLVTQG